MKSYANDNDGRSNGYKNNKIGQDQLYDLLISRELSWQAIIYDLIQTEQLDPWDIDLGLLARKYVEKIRQLQELEEGTFFISSKVLLAAALLLRIKSERLRDNILSIDEILFEEKTRKDEIVGPSQIIDFYDGELPEILPKTPLPRGRKVTLQELMVALDKAINTEHRRIKKELAFRRARYNIETVLPRKTVDVKQRIIELYKKIRDFFLGKKNDEEKLTYTMLVGESRDEKIAGFLPVLHLDTQEKIVLEQPAPFEEINIWLKENAPKKEWAEERIEEKKEIIS
ncbi:MAG: segregation/condensation protein A [Candidatus Pacearchaeota archaeon]|nr:segregation/condensation protein A [Candidatus Pacearchaeota archaeon]